MNKESKKIMIPKDKVITKEQVLQIEGLLHLTRTHAKKAVKLKETWIRQSARFGNVSVISVFEKITDEYDEKSGGGKSA